MGERKGHEKKEQEVEKRKQKDFEWQKAFMIEILQVLPHCPRQYFI